MNLNWVHPVIMVPFLCKVLYDILRDHIFHSFSAHIYTIRCLPFSLGVIDTSLSSELRFIPHHRQDLRLGFHQSSFIMMRSVSSQLFNFLRQSWTVIISSKLFREHMIIFFSHLFVVFLVFLWLLVFFLRSPFRSSRLYAINCTLY